VFSDLFPEHQEETQALDLLRKMLAFHPNERLTIEEALAHPFMETLHNPQDEPAAAFKVAIQTRPMTTHPTLHSLSPPPLTHTHTNTNIPLSVALLPTCLLLKVEFDFENEVMGRERVQELIWAEIRELHQGIPPTYPGCGRVRPTPKPMGMGNGNGGNGGGGGDPEMKAEAKNESKEGNNTDAKLTRKRSISPSSK